MRRNILLSLLLVIGLLSAFAAEAHEPPTTMTASTELRGTAVEMTSSPGTWSFKVVALSGKPAKATLLIATDTDGDTIIDSRNANICKPQLNKICTNHQIIPAGTQNLSLGVSGGNGPASVTIEIYHP